MMNAAFTLPSPLRFGVGSRRTSPLRARRHLPGPCLAAPAYDRQIALADRLAPAETHRGDTAVLLRCEDDDGAVQPAVDALRERWLIDAVHEVRCPFRSTEVVNRRHLDLEWLGRRVAHAVAKWHPSVIAVLDRSVSASAAGWGLALAGRLTEWGLREPIAVLRVHPEGEVEWLTTPLVQLEETG